MLQGALAREGAFSSVESMRDTLSGLSSDIGEKMQLAPVRALSVSLGQIMQTAAGGRGGILERAGKARELTSRAGKAVTRYEDAQRRSRESMMQIGAIKSGTVGAGPDDMFASQADKDAALAKARAEKSDAFETRMKQKSIVEQRTEKASKATSEILTTPQMIRAQAAGTIGIVGGTLAFTAAMAAAQAAMELIGKATDDAADRMMGFAKTATRVSTELAASIQQSGGNVSGAVAGRAASIGYVGDLYGVETMAGRQAGLQNMQASIEMARANAWARRNGFEVGSGSVRGIGNNMGNGLLPGTFLDFLNSTPGAVEQFAGRMGYSPSMLGGGTAGYQGLVPSAPFSPLVAGGGGGDIQKQLQVIQEVYNPFSGKSAQQRLDTVNEILGLTGNQVTQKGVDEFNDTVIKAGAEFGKLVYDPSKTKEIEQTYQAMRQAGVDEGVARSYSARGVYAQDASGRGVTTGSQINNLFSGLIKGQTMPTASGQLEMMRRGLQVQIGQMYNQQALQQQLSIPAQFAQNLLSNPLASSSAVGILPTGMDAPADLMASFSEYGPRIKGVRDQLSDLQADGMKAMEALAPNEAQRKQLQGLTGDIKALSEESRTLAEANVGAQLALSEAEYANQLRLAKRSLGDALGLEGKKTALVGDQVVKATRLGELQRQQVMVSRQSEQLSLQMNQRELNFAIALSRINTPGSTPIERATRAREQELLNRDRQRQQDYAEQGFGLGKAIQNIEFSRSTIDQIKSLGLMLQGRDLEIQIRNTQPLIEANNQLISYKQNLVSSITETGTSMKQLRITALAEIQAASGDFSDETAKMVDQQVSDMSEKWKGFFAGLVAAAPPIPGTGTTVSPSTSTTPKKGYTYDPESGLYIKDYGATGTPNTNAYASGTVFDAAKGAYSMTVGEAGTEHVAVLRNPRRMPWTQFGGGGGSSSVTINMNGTWSVRSDGDVDAIADSVARRVEERLNRRAAVFASREL